MSRHHTDHEDGYIVLITVLILGVIVSTIAAFLLITGADASVASEAVESGTAAKAAATGCAELALYAIQQSPTLTTPSNGSATLSTSPQESCTYAISGTTPNYTILAIGTVNQNSGDNLHSITVTTTQTSPSVTVSSWQDTP